MSINDVYVKLLSDKLPANLGYLYENLVAQIIAASGREMFYHTWEKNGSIHYYEVTRSDIKILKQIHSLGDE